MSGRRALVTAGPTAEPLDPVRILTNRSSGKQGYAIAAALAKLGAEVTLVSGPVALPAPPGVNVLSTSMISSATSPLPNCAAVTGNVSSVRSREVAANVPIV